MRLFRCDSFLGLSEIVCRLVGKVRGDASTRVQRAAGLMGLSYIPRTEGVFGPHLDGVTRRIASSAADAGIPYVEVRLADEGMSEDGLHPNDRGYRVIADRLRSLGYDPSYPR